MGGAEPSALGPLSASTQAIWRSRTPNALVEQTILGNVLADITLQPLVGLVWTSNSHAVSHGPAMYLLPQRVLTTHLALVAQCLGELRHICAN
jgi:hypothetical protein